MRKISYFLLLLTVMSLHFIGLQAQSFTVDGLTYSVESPMSNPQVVKVISNSADGNSTYTGDIVIPGVVYYENEAYIVNSIGSGAFKNCSGVTSVTFVDTCTAYVTVLDENGNIQTVPMQGYFISSIENSAFEGCSGIESIALPSSLLELGYDAFANCTNLKNLSVENSNKDFYISLEEHFGGCYLENVYCNTNNFQAYFINQNNSIKFLTFGDNVTTISDCKYLNALQHLTIGKNVSSFIGFTFKDCNIDTVEFLSDQCPTVNSNPFTDNVLQNAVFIVPCGASFAFSHWNNNFSTTKTVPIAHLEEAEGCNPISFDEYYLDGNNIKAFVNPNGRLFYNTIKGEFYAPKNGVPLASSDGQENTVELLSSVFCANIWMTCYDQAGNLHVAASKFDQLGQDYFYGPIANERNQEFAKKYNRVWNVSKDDIIYHVTHFHESDYEMKESIKNWPANGNASNGESNKLAPFYDRNNNGIYEPEQGDYPSIRGDYALYFMFNDNGGNHTGSLGEELSVEVHALAYAYDTTDDALNNTVFIDYRIINRSDNNYNDFTLSAWADMDLGYAFDDYVGFNNELNMFYTYNGKDTDGPGDGAYPDNPPAQGLMVLNQTASGFMYYNNNNETIGEPLNASDYYNYAHQIWKDGKHVKFGGNGYNSNTSEEDYNFMFDGDPIEGTGWTEVSAGNLPGDRRGLINMNIGSLNSKDTVCLTVAYPFAWKKDGQSSKESIALLNEYAKSIQDFHSSKNYGCSVYDTLDLKALNASLNETNQNSELFIYPNPAKDKVVIECQGEFTVSNALGQIVYKAKSINGTHVINLKNFESGIYFVKSKDRVCKLIVR